MIASTPLPISIATKHSNEDYNEDLISKQETLALAKTSLQQIPLNHIQTMSPDKAESNIVEDTMRIENAVTQGASQAQAEIRPELQEASLRSVQDAINDVDAKIKVLTSLFHNTAALWREKYGTLRESPFCHKARYSREFLIDIDLRTDDDSWDYFVAGYQQGRERYLQTSDAKHAIRDLRDIFERLELMLEEGIKGSLSFFSLSLSDWPIRPLHVPGASRGPLNLVIDHSSNSPSPPRQAPWP